MKVTQFRKQEQITCFSMERELRTNASLMTVTCEHRDSGCSNGPRRDLPRFRNTGAAGRKGGKWLH